MDGYIVMKSGDEVRRLNGAIALVRLNTTGADREAVRGALKATYASMPKGFAGLRLKGQLVAAMAHTYDGALLPFIRDQIASRKNNPELRLIAAQNYALLAGPEEAKSMQALIASEPVPDRMIYDQKTFRHPVFDAKALAAQRQLNALQGENNTWFAGAYTRHGFHEDGFASAARIARLMERQFA